MVGLGAVAEARFLDLHEVADLHAVAGVCPGAESGVGADNAAGPEPGAFQMREGVNDASLSEVTSGSDDDMRFDDHITFDYGIG